MRGSARTQRRSPRQVTSTSPHPRAVMQTEFLYSGSLHSVRSAFDLKDLQQRQRRAQKHKAAQAGGTQSINRKVKIFFSERLGLCDKHSSWVASSSYSSRNSSFSFFFHCKKLILLRINIGKGLFASLKAAVSGLEFQGLSVRHRKN